MPSREGTGDWTIRLVTLAPVFPWWALLVDVLVTARITRLLTKDTLPPVKNAREGLLRRYRGSQWASLWVCPWCMSFWIALLVFVAHLLVAFTAGPFGVAVYAVVLAPLAISYVVGFLAEYEGA